MLNAIKVCVVVVLLMVLVFLFAGCGFTPQGDAVRGLIKAGTERAARQGLVNMEWGLCWGAPIGAIRERYGKGALAGAYTQLCEGSSKNLLDVKGDR